MYKPVVTGRIRHKFIVEEYAKIVLKEIGLGKLRTRPIGIEFKNNADGALGLCEGDKTFAQIYISKVCPITKRKLSFLEMMKTMTHELVHAKQFLRGELNSEGGWRWKGKKANGYEYDNQPWEVEANKLEADIFGRCFPWHLPFEN